MSLLDQPSKNSPLNSHQSYESSTSDEASEFMNHDWSHDCATGCAANEVVAAVSLQFSKDEQLLHKNVLLVSFAV